MGLVGGWVVDVDIEGGVRDLGWGLGLIDGIGMVSDVMGIFGVVCSFVRLLIRCFVIFLFV